MRIRKFRNRGGQMKRYWHFIKRYWGRIILGSGFLVLGILFIYGKYFLPSVENAEQLSFAESTIIYDRKALDPLEDPDDHILYVIHGDENREYIPLGDISPWVLKATIAIEDDQFYHHFGFDVGGLLKAVLNKVTGLGTARGGSTITQQLVKNTFLSREKTISRKFKELLLSIKVEWNYEKDDILELYLNKIPYGSNTNGIEAAARKFFGKSARELSLAESAILASLPVAPTRFSPYGANRDMLMGTYELNPITGERVRKKGRKDLVLERMWNLGMINDQQFRDAIAEAESIEFKTDKTDIKAPHFVFLVRQKLEEKYGKEFLRQGGLRIYTSIDPELQNIAEETITTKSAHYPGTYGAKNAALLSLNTDTGEVLAYVGGKDYFDEENDGQVDVLTSRRQPGSSFKPLTYAAAFMEGYAPSTVLFDVETDFGGNYTPHNFDGLFAGPVSAREALNRSLNVPAVKMAYLATPAKVLALAYKLGIKFEGDGARHGVAVGIGVAEVEPLSHIASFQTFAGDGSYHDPTVILEIQDAQGRVLEKADFEATKKEGMDAEVAALVRNILTDESTRPTTDDFDWNVLLQLEGYNNGAKTGTSNRVAKNPEFNEELPESDENKKLLTVPGDSWTIGFTPHLVTGVWVGNNKGEPMKLGATGLAVAAPIWKKFMTDAHASLVANGADPKKLYNEPIPLEVRKINRFSGKLATDETPEALVREEVFASFSVPTELDDSLKVMEIDKISGRPATKYTPFYAKTQKYVLSLKSILPEKPNWQNPVDEWIKEHPKFLTSLGAILDSEDNTDEIEEDLLSPQDRRLYSRLNNLPDDVHNEFTQRHAPVIQILSPRKGGALSRGGVEVKVAIQAKFGIKAVEYSLDDQLVADSTSYPYTGRFSIPESISLGSKHVLKVVAIDTLMQSSMQEIPLEIRQDTTPPDIIFLGPIGNQKIPLNSNIYVFAEIKDFESKVENVEFFLDDVSLGSTTRAPYKGFFKADQKLGRHFLKIVAKDANGNVGEKSIPIWIEREKLISETDPTIEKVTKYRNSFAVDLIFPAPETIESAKIIMKEGDKEIHVERLSDIAKMMQVQLPKKGLGTIEIELRFKVKGAKDWTKGGSKSVRL